MSRPTVQTAKKTHRPGRWRDILSVPCEHGSAHALPEWDVEYRACYSSRWDKELSPLVKAVWDEMRREAAAHERRVPFDARKFRLDGVTVNGGRFILRIGISSYSEYIAYRSSSWLRAVARERARVRGFVSDAFFPNVIGNVAVLLSSDNRTLAVRRTRHVSTYAGYHDLPGGHPEPSFVSQRVGPQGSDMINRAVRAELVEAVRREINEELHIGIDAIGEPRLVTVLINNYDIDTPDMVFLLPISATADAIRSAFMRAGETHQESNRVSVFDPLVKPNRALFPMTPIMEGALAIMRTRGHVIMRCVCR